MTTARLMAGPEAIEQAAGLLRAGRLVAFPTETVYGLGADATSGPAVKSLFAAKSRPANNPLIVHVARFEDACELARFDRTSELAAAAFWPGPLTLVLPIAPNSGISSLVNAGQSTLALRIPSHPVALALIASAGVPIAAPSANTANRISPTEADHVLADLEGRIDAVIDAGSCALGLESTVVRASNGRLELLRPGALTAEAIERQVGIEVTADRDPTAIIAPGRLPSHYSPRTPVRMNATGAADGEILLGYGKEFPDAEFNLSPDGSLEAAAARFYALLRDADELAVHSSATAIAVARIPETGLGRALNDRLTRASGQMSGGSTARCEHGRSDAK